MKIILEAFFDNNFGGLICYNDICSGELFIVVFGSRIFFLSNRAVLSERSEDVEDSKEVCVLCLVFSNHFEPPSKYSGDLTSWKNFSILSMLLTLVYFLRTCWTLTAFAPL